MVTGTLCSAEGSAAEAYYIGIAAGVRGCTQSSAPMESIVSPHHMEMSREEAECSAIVAVGVAAAVLPARRGSSTQKRCLTRVVWRAVEVTLMEQVQT